MEFDSLSKQVIGAALEVHRALGPGLLESVYEQALAYEPTSAGLKTQLEVPVPVAYKAVRLDCGFRLDLLVEEQLVVELKSVEALVPLHDAQLLTYLKLTGFKIGLLINFNVSLLKQGIKRLVL
ncbi:MAG TPA: GxxExxY protein [Lacunisphaera sp.]|nr:GxxExxY protein [Lacunisphaera sp.]